MLIVCPPSYSYVELGLNYSYSKQIVGEEENNVSISESNGGTWAWFMWEYTALEFNYAVINDTITDTNEQVVALDDVNSITIIETTSRIKTVVQGVGIRQALAPRKSKVVPMISIGYAKQISQGSTLYRFRVNDGEDEEEQENELDAQEIDSAFFGLSIRISFTQTFGINIGGKTVFPSSEPDKAKNNVRYMAGLTWLF